MDDRRILDANFARGEGPSKNHRNSFIAHLRSAASVRALGVALLVAAPSAAFAQQAATPSDDQAVATAAKAKAPAAQDAPAQVEEVVVTGFRAAVANAIAEKRNSEQILESISAEDIGKLPDNSIAESIARLPGVTAQRVDGRDQVISIRGFAPDFSTTLLNGREQVTTGDNRAVEFDQYPSELLGQVVVYKTPSAGLVGQGISGTIDLRTIRPLAYGKKVIALSARGENVSKGKLNAGSKDNGYRISGTYVDQFADDTIGVTLGVAHIESPSQFERFNSWGYTNFDGNNATYGALQGDGSYKVRPEYAAAQGKLIIGGAKPFVQSNELKRTGVVGTLEYRPNDNFSSIVDLYYTKFQEEQILRGIELPLAWGNAILQPGFTVTDNTVTAGAWSNVKGVVRNDYIERNAEIFSAGWNTKYTTGDWTLVGDASYSRVNRQDFYVETYAGTSRSAGNGPYDTMKFNTESNGITTFTSQLDYADPNLIKLTSPQGWAAGNPPTSVPGGQDGYLSNPKVEDALFALRGSAAKAFQGAITSVEVGANYTGRKKSYRPHEFFLAATANVNDPAHNTSVVVPPQYRLGTTSLAYLGIPGMVSFDTMALIDNNILSRLANPSADITLNTWSMKEDVLTGWLRADFDKEVGYGTLTGNAGLQVVYTDQSSDGRLNLVGGVSGGTAVTEGAKYTEVLPSLNSSLRFDEKNVLRFGLARTLARPRMDQMKASFNYSTTPSLATSTDPYHGFWGGGGGNAKLKPWIADGADVSFEHYFSRNGYVAAAAYYKYLESYVYEKLSLHDFTGVPPVGLPAGVTAPGTNQGVLKQPVNGDGGKLYGFELSGTLPFNAIWEKLDGFGALASYSYTKSEIQANPENPTQPLPGLSTHVANATLYFEKNGFSARTSMRYRSKFLAEVISLGPGARNRSAQAETVVDAQLGYEFQDGPLKGLNVLAQMSNVTDEPFVTRDSANDLIIDSQEYGRRYLLGLSYKF